MFQAAIIKYDTTKLIKPVIIGAIIAPLTYVVVLLVLYALSLNIRQDSVAMMPIKIASCIYIISLY